MKENNEPKQEQESCKIRFENIKGLKEIHDHNIVHSSLSPSSILVSYKSSTLKVEDVRIGNFDQLERILQKEINENIYTAPEVSRKGKVTTASNMWSLGRIMYFIMFRVHLAG